MVICLERDADLHMAQLMPLPLTVSCSNKIQIGFTFLVPADLGTPGKRAVKRVCVCVYISAVLHSHSNVLTSTGIENGIVCCVSVQSTHVDGLISRPITWVYFSLPPSKSCWAPRVVSLS